MEGSLQVKLLGEFSLVYQDRHITDVDTPRLQSLLAYLLLHQQTPQSRQQLAFLFWPDSSESQARTNLRNLLYLLREALPQADRCLVVDNQTIQWKPEPPCRLDVAEFEAGLKRAEKARSNGDQAAEQEGLQEALSLYQGDLLPSCYDDWIIPERERLSQAFVKAAKRLVELLEAGRSYDEAIRVARRLLRGDPLDEWTHRKLMRLYAQDGALTQALQSYHNCVEILEDELGVEPSPPTRELYEQLLEMDSQPFRTPRGEASGWPLVGRRAAWRQLLAAWKIATESRPHMAVLSGEAGIGKTRLGEEMLHWAAKQGATVGQTRSYPGEGNLAYTPLLNLLRNEPFKTQVTSLKEVWLREAARLLPEILAERPDLAPPEPLTEDWQRQRLFEACARAILKGKGPLLLLIDDMQWADRGTLEWLHYLLRYDPPPQVLVVGAVRLEEVAPESYLDSLCADLHRSGQLTNVEISRLSEPETLELIEHVAGKKPDPDLAYKIYQESEGNPLFVVEMTQSQLSPGPKRGFNIPLAASARASPGTVLPPKIQSVIESRLAGISGEARQLASAAAVIGRAFPFEALKLAVPGEEEALVQGLDELWRIGVIRERDPSVYDFGHDKFREVIYQGLSPPRRAHLHRKVARALEELYPNRMDEMAARLGRHYLAGGEKGAAIPYLVKAGKQASRLYAHSETIQSYQKAIDLMDEHPGEQDQSLQWSALQGMGKALLQVARYREAEQVFKRLTREAGEAEDQKALAKGWLGMSIVQDRLGDHSEARKSAERAEGAARAAGAQEELGTAVLLKGWAACQLGDQKDAIELGEKALELSQDSGNRREMARSLNLLGQANDVLGNYEQARGYKEKALALFQELDDRRWIGTMLNNLANTANYRGEYERAIPLYEEALTILNQVSDSHMVMATLVNLGAARVGAGDYRAAEEDLRQVLELCTDSDWMGLSLTHSWLAEALLGIGEVEEAAVEAQRALEQARVSGRVEDLGVAWRMVGECAWKTSKPIPIDDKPYTPAECFKISLETLTEIDAEPETAWTLRKWAEYEMHSGDFIRGREMWDQAREIFSRLDMPAQVARMDQTPPDRG